jgi:hypothetical protein
VTRKKVIDKLVSPDRLLKFHEPFFVLLSILLNIIFFAPDAPPKKKLEFFFYKILRQAKESICEKEKAKLGGRQIL